MKTTINEEQSTLIKNLEKLKQRVNLYFGEDSLRKSDLADPNAKLLPVNGQSKYNSI